MRDFNVFSTSRGKIEAAITAACGELGIPVSAVQYEEKAGDKRDYDSIVMRQSNGVLHVDTDTEAMDVALGERIVELAER